MTGGAVCVGVTLHLFVLRLAVWCLWLLGNCAAGPSNMVWFLALLAGGKLVRQHVEGWEAKHAVRR